MFDKWLKLPAHYYLRITALVILIVGVAISNVLMSIGAIWIISNWLIEAKFREYWQRLKSSPELIAILLFLALSVFSVSWSEDFWYAFHDIRIKLPLLAIPLALGTGKPLEEKILYFLMQLFVGIVAYAAAYNYWNYIGGGVQQDIRQMSVFISQIRFAALVDLALFITLFLALKRKLNLLAALVLISFFLFYTYFAQVLNGYILLLALSFVSLLYGFWNIRSVKLKWLISCFALGATIVAILFFQHALKTYHGLDDVVYEQLDEKTPNGLPYFHDTTNKQTENGHYVWLYVQQDEMEREWNRRSVIKYDSLDQKGQPMFGTLMRYLTSKNARKDSTGVAQLSDAEVKQIEAGLTGINANNGLEAKIHSFLFEYEMYSGGADPNGFSLLQRLEHLKAAWAILEENWIFGVGVGDVDHVFQLYYESVNSKLLPENRLRSHNQFLSIWIALGLIGLILAVLVFILPLIRNKNRDYFLWIVLTALFISFLFEDMLETQAGITIFSLFYALAVFREKPSDPQSKTSSLEAASGL